MQIVSTAGGRHVTLRAVLREMGLRTEIVHSLGLDVLVRGGERDMVAPTCPSRTNMSACRESAAARRRATVDSWDLIATSADDGGGQRFVVAATVRAFMNCSLGVGSAAT